VRGGGNFSFCRVPPLLGGRAPSWGSSKGADFFARSHLGQGRTAKGRLSGRPRGKKTRGGAGWGGIFGGQGDGRGPDFGARTFFRSVFVTKKKVIGGSRANHSGTFLRGGGRGNSVRKSKKGPVGAPGPGARYFGGENGGPPKRGGELSPSGPSHQFWFKGKGKGRPKKKTCKKNHPGWAPIPFAGFSLGHSSVDRGLRPPKKTGAGPPGGTSKTGRFGGNRVLPLFLFGFGGAFGETGRGRKKLTFGKKKKGHACPGALPRASNPNVSRVPKGKKKKKRNPH